MKDNFNKIVLGAALILAAILIMSSCVTQEEYHPDCPVCEGCSAGEEDPYLCSKYYEDKEEITKFEAKFGSHEFFLKGQDPNNYEN